MCQEALSQSSSNAVLPFAAMMSQTPWKVGMETPADSRLAGAGLLDKRPVPRRLVESGLQHPEVPRPMIRREGTKRTFEGTKGTFEYLPGSG